MPWPNEGNDNHLSRPVHRSSFSTRIPMSRGCATLAPPWRSDERRVWRCQRQRVSGLPFTRPL